MHKIFISYSWTPNQNKDRVKYLADRLISDGIDVIIDIYDLQPGNDRFYFMERMVADVSIEKVLIICNESYTKKANSRSGGVGIESTIITPEVYSRVSQTKFIPIVFEKDSDNEPYLPIYLKSTVYFDFSDPQNFEQAYYDLLNNIRGNIVKPKPIQANHLRNSLLKKDFSIGDLELPYLPIISSWNKNINEYRYGDVNVKQLNSKYTPPPDFLTFFEGLPFEQRNTIEQNCYEPKVRLENYGVINRSGYMPSEITLTVSEIKYSDFIKTNCILDEKIPLSSITFREKYFEKDGSLVKSNLSNICGVGVFIITSDKKVIVSKTSNYVNVNPNVYAFSASGTMDWKKDLHPFDEVARECLEEIGHAIDIENLYLFSVGLDYRLGYYEFSFYEKSIYTADEIIKKASMARDYGFEVGDLLALDFDYSIINHMRINLWDVVSEATLLTLLSKEFGKSNVEKYIAPKKLEDDFRKRMLNTWKNRSQREGCLAVLSNRFPYKDIDKISQNYIINVMNFIDTEDLENKHILEIGCGIGLLTEKIAQKCKKVTSIDLSVEMITRAKKHINKAGLNNISFVNCFFQDFDTNQKYDAAICSLVLTHNQDETERTNFIEKMKNLTDTIYLFEPTNFSAQSSPESTPESIDTYLNYFPEYMVTKIQKYYLHLDEIAFIKLKKIHD